MPSIVTLLTDFGFSDHYVAALKGTILSVDPAITIVDITHDVPAHQIRAAAFALGACHADFPDGTVHLAVVDPGVGSSRRAICIEALGQRFVGPDNGIFSGILDADPAARIHRIEPARVATRVSSTFHGRDLFAPVAARLAVGASVDSVGPPVADPVRLADWSAVRRADGSIAGRVVHVDRFGNCVTNLRPADFGAGDWRRHRYSVGSGTVTGTRRFYSDGTGEEPFVILGSTGRLEISIDGDSAAGRLGTSVGDAVVATPA